MGVFVFTFLHGNISFLRGNVSMFLGFLFLNNGVCFVGLYCRQCCCFYNITVAVNFIDIIIIIGISNIIVIIIIILTLFFSFYPYFNVIITVSILPNILPIFIIEFGPCTIYTFLYRNLILYDLQNEICTKKYCELIKVKAEIFSL